MWESVLRSTRTLLVPIARERELSKSPLIALIDTTSTSTSQDQDIKGNVNSDGLEYCVGVIITIVLQITIMFIDYCYHVNIKTYYYYDPGHVLSVQFPNKSVIPSTEPDCVDRFLRILG